MNFKFKRELYESLPLWCKNIACVVPFEIIAGKQYRAVLARDVRLDKASHSEVKRYQEMALGKMLDFATKQVPAYKPYRSSVLRYKPHDAIKVFPLLDKNVLQADMASYLPIDFEKIPHYELSTGGTSGKQLKFFVDSKSQSVEMGFVHRLWKRMDYTPRSKKATFRGVSFNNLKPGQFWQYNPIYKELQFSPFHMSENNLSAYVDQLILYKPEYLHGYPSAIDALAEFIQRNGLIKEIPVIKAAFLVSEGCTVQQRKRIEESFQTRVFSFYGHSERVIMAGECEKNNTYHHFPDYGFLEIIDDDGNQCDLDGERGELVGTGFLNSSFPLIRYRTGDYATRCESNCSCGRNWDRFRDVVGRWKQEMLIGRHGSKVSIAALNMHGPLFDKVVRYQYLQNKIGEFSILLMVSPEFANKDRIAIEKAYQKKVGDELSVTVKMVEDIPLTSRGKVKLLRCEII